MQTYFQKSIVARGLVAASCVLVFALLVAGCAASPERKRGESLAIDAIYRDFNCPALASEAERLDVEIKRADAAASNPAQWIPIVNLFTLPSEIRGIQDMEAAKARLEGVRRAQIEQGCPESPSPATADAPPAQP